MSRKIAVQKELTDLKKKLANLGYEVSDIDDNENVEAIVYMADGYNIPYNNQMTNIVDGEDIDSNQNAIMINATGKTIREIDNIIENRIYSPLFD